MDELLFEPLDEVTDDGDLPECPRCGGERIVLWDEGPDGYRPCSYCGGHPTGWGSGRH